MDNVADDEYLLRHIPGGTLWQAPGPRITSANFQLRHDRQETGVSVTRWKITTPQRLLELVGGSAEAGSRIACARVADVRKLGLRVVPKPLETDAGTPRSSRIRPAWMTMPVGKNWRCSSNSCQPTRHPLRQVEGSRALTILTA